MSPPFSPPFSTALVLRRDAEGLHATLGPQWTVGDKAHGGILLALLAKAALTELSTSDGQPEPLVVSAEFLTAPEQGPVLLRPSVVKRGRTASVVTVTLRQGGRAVLTGTVTAGRLPTEEPLWAALPSLSAEPPAHAIDPATAAGMGEVFTLSRSCDIRIDPGTAGFLTDGGIRPPLLHLWLRPRGEPPDPLFLLLAGDVSPPTVFNLGPRGWSPTVQMTTLLRGRPAPGWLRIEVAARSVAGGWFDEDATVLDSAGRLVCQARQLALLPRGGAG